MAGKYKKLFLIGNGFDRWQNMPTSYEEFRKYYRDHVKEVAKKLKIKVKSDKNGALITPVEMIYGDIFHPDKLENDFFWTMESAMARIDDQNINLYFGKSNQGLYRMQETLQKALDLLHQVFSEWITSIEIDDRVPRYRFGDDCYFVNFNYTETLERCFGIVEANIDHIHGEASDPESIIVGHSQHPEIAFPELMEQKFIRTPDGGKSKRFMGLYLVEAALYETDKSIQDNIDVMCEIMAFKNFHFEDITDIYVLGHSFAEVDYEYFDFFVKASQGKTDLNSLSVLWEAREEWGDVFGSDENNAAEDLLDWIRLNIQYASENRRRSLGRDNISFPVCEEFEKRVFGRANVFTDADGNVYEYEGVSEEARKAVHKRFLLEQTERTREAMNEFALMRGLEEYPGDIFSVPSLAAYIDDQNGNKHSERMSDARWHTSYLSDDDKVRIEDVMKRAGCTNYELHPSIDECIEEFRVTSLDS